MDVDVVLLISPRYKSSTIGDSLGLFPIPLPWVDFLDGLECLDTMHLPDLKCIKTSQVYKLGSFVKAFKVQFQLSFLLFLCTTLIFMVLEFMVMVVLSSLRLYGYGFFLWFFYVTFYGFYGCFCFIVFMVFVEIWIAIWILLLVLDYGCKFSFWLSKILALFILQIFP